MIHDYFPDILNLENLIKVPKSDLSFVKTEDKFDPYIIACVGSRVVGEIISYPLEETRSRMITTMQKSVVSLFEHAKRRIGESGLEYPLMWTNQFKDWVYDGWYIRGPLKVNDITLDYLIKIDDGIFKFKVELHAFFKHEDKILDLDGKEIVEPKEKT